MSIQGNSESLTYREIVELWQREKSFARFFSATLAAQPFAAFFWEVRPVKDSTLDAPFECVIADSPALAGVAADGRPFDTQLAPSRARNGICSFENLGGDALLVAPCLASDRAACAHLADFLRRADSDRHESLWAAVSSALQTRLGAQTVWLNTSGLGVYWLHLRLDSFPKYYTHVPYRQPDWQPWN